MPESEARSRSSMIIRNGTALLKNGILSEGHDNSGNSDAIKTASICFSAGNGDICFLACLGIIQHAVSWHPLQARPNRESDSVFSLNIATTLCGHSGNELSYKRTSSAN